ncbi:hypothetical protein DWQ65_09520 [Treponema phagedenis]|uniref:Uncharacterized protein n=1 Tax=Treponema phagedenis TaxID=162 RepID=A0AAE6IW20_TREPH|nr:hypothetical protein FUT79_14235 [Treponema phagedenis]QEJ99334.1 hypothetical protein FUT82_15955 [Treponema phagedenis]QEK00020.1 hypothetical protein FUT84_01710 [Treponema phagedenis]QEK04905.1 hypothetical protein FUT83_14605 [Treponema phagedenis]QEK07477.1 hypothetical protein FUT80_12615 [Treponema phagedenis]
MVNCSPLLNSKRCLKASTLFCKIEAFKLAGLVFATDVKTVFKHSCGKFAHRCAVSNSFL